MPKYDVVKSSKIRVGVFIYNVILSKLIIGAHMNVEFNRHLKWVYIFYLE